MDFLHIYTNWRSIQIHISEVIDQVIWYKMLQKKLLFSTTKNYDVSIMSISIRNEHFLRKIHNKIFICLK